MTSISSLKKWGSTFCIMGQRVNLFCELNKKSRCSENEYKKAKIKWIWPETKWPIDDQIEDNGNYWKIEPVPVEKVSDELWIGVKG